MKKYLTYSFLLFLALPVFVQSQNQTDNFVFQKLIPGDYSYLNVDLFDNIYLINSSKQLIKLNSNGDSIAAYNDVKRFGSPSYIDVSNPMKLLVYYGSFATAVILDKQLIFRNNINLRKQNFYNTETVATSYDNNLWLFDLQDFKLKKIDDKGASLLETVDLRTLSNEVPTPKNIFDSNNKVMLYDEEKGFFIFDYYGGYLQQIPFIHWQNVSANKDFLYGFNGNILYAYRLSSLQLLEYKLPAFIKDYKQIKAVNGKLYLIKKEGIEIYKIQ